MLSGAEKSALENHNHLHLDYIESIISENRAESTGSIKVYRGLNEDKKTGKAREEARLIPIPPLYTGSVAWIDALSPSSLLDITSKILCTLWSNLSSSLWQWQVELHISMYYVLCMYFGIFEQKISDMWREAINVRSW